METDKVRDLFIVSKLHLLQEVLQPFKIKERLSFKELKEQTTLKGGSLAAALKDAKNLKLIHKNGSLTLTSDGQLILNNPSPELIKKIALQIPLFRQMMDNHITTRDSAEVYVKDVLKNAYNDQTRKIVVSQSVLRYLEMIIGMDPKDARLPTNNPSSSFDRMNRYYTLFQSIDYLKQKNFNPEEITHAVSLIFKEKVGR